MTVKQAWDRTASQEYSQRACEPVSDGCGHPASFFELRNLWARAQILREASELDAMNKAARERLLGGNA